MWVFRLHHSNKRAEVPFCAGGAVETAGGGLTARMQLLIWKSVQSAPYLFIYFCVCLRQAGLSAVGSPMAAGLNRPSEARTPARTPRLGLGKGWDLAGMWAWTPHPFTPLMVWEVSGENPPCRDTVRDPDLPLALRSEWLSPAPRWQRAPWVSGRLARGLTWVLCLPPSSYGSRERPVLTVRRPSGGAAR